MIPSKLRLYVSLFILGSFPVYSQDSAYFVLTTGGDTLYGEAEIDRNLLASNEVKLGNQILPVSSVAAVNNKKGYFRRLSTVGSGESFASRIKDGAIIDRYESITVRVKSGVPLPVSIMYYSKNNGPLLEIVPENVMQDFMDNPGSRMSLREFENRDRLASWCIFGGLLGAMGVVGTAMFGGQYTGMLPETIRGPMFFLGLGACGVSITTGFIVNMTKWPYLQRAIYAAE